MKKAIVALLLFAATVAIADAASGQIIRTGTPRTPSRNYHHNSRPHTAHHSYEYSRPHHHPYRYGHPVFYAPYYSLSPYAYSSYSYNSYYNRDYYYDYGYPGVSVNYTTYNDPDAPGYAVGGAVVGGVLGAILGNNSRGHHGHNSWVGAAIGSTIGYLAGSAADNAAIREQRAAAAAATATAANHPGTVVREPDCNTGFYEQPSSYQQDTQTTPAVKHKYNYTQTPMSQANALFGRQ